MKQNKDNVSIILKQYQKWLNIIFCYDKNENRIMKGENPNNMEQLYRNNSWEKNIDT